MAQEETRTEAEAAAVAAERRAPRRSAAQMITVGVIASIARDRARPPDRLVPARRLDAGRQDRHALGRPDHRLGPGLRARDHRDRGFSILKFRMRPGEEHLDGPPIHGNTRLEVIWTAIPAILIVGLVTYAYVVLRDIEKAPAGRRQTERVVHVTGQQFAWTFEYNEGGKPLHDRAALPARGRVGEVRRPVQGRHPRLLGAGLPHEDRRRARASRRTTASRRRPRLGPHPIVCAELCGLGHAFMRQTAHVDDPAAVRRLGRSGRAAPRPRRRRRGQAGAAPDAKALFTNGSTATGATAAAPATRSGRRGHERDDRPRPRQGPQGQGRRRSSSSRSSQPDAEIATGFRSGIMPPNFARVR